MWEGLTVLTVVLCAVFVCMRLGGREPAVRADVHATSVHCNSGPGYFTAQ